MYELEDIVKAHDVVFFDTCVLTPPYKLSESRFTGKLYNIQNL